MRGRLRNGPPGGVWSVHGGRELMHKPLDAQSQNA
jgi:hypothetical protein